MDHNVTARHEIEEIRRLEAVMREHPGQVLLQPKHHFAPGMYARELFIPAGTALVGRMHRTEHLSVLAQGEIDVLMDGIVVRCKAPFVIHSMPGAKRVGYAVTDCTWICFHATDTKNLDDLEAELIVPEHLELETQKCLG